MYEHHWTIFLGASTDRKVSQQGPQEWPRDGESTYICAVIKHEVSRGLLLRRMVNERLRVHRISGALLNVHCSELFSLLGGMLCVELLRLLLFLSGPSDYCFICPLILLAAYLNSTPGSTHTFRVVFSAARFLLVGVGLSSYSELLSPFVSSAAFAIFSFGVEGMAWEETVGSVVFFGPIFGSEYCLVFKAKFELAISGLIKIVGLACK